MKHCQTASMCDNDEIGGDDDDGDGGAGRSHCDDDNDDNGGDGDGGGGDDDGNLTPSQNVMQDCQSESYPAH